MQVMTALARRGFAGPLNVQLFGPDEQGHGPRVIEANLRLGSGSVLGNVATRGRLFHALLAEAAGVTSADDFIPGEPSDYEVGVQLDRYLGDVFSVQGRVERIIPDEEPR